MSVTGIARHNKHLQWESHVAGRGGHGDVEACHCVTSQPGDNIKANSTSQKWTPFGMLAESGGIPRKLTKYLPSTRLQGGQGCTLPAAADMETSSHIVTASANVTPCGFKTVIAPGGESGPLRAVHLFARGVTQPSFMV